MQIQASIIIITYNSAAQIGACLDAVARLEPQGAYEVIVLDNASADASAERVRTLFPQVRLIVESENWGFAGGVNRAVEQAQSQYILLLNPDALPEPTWASELLVALREHGAGVVGSKVLEPDGRVQSLGTIVDETTLLTAHRTEALGDRMFPVQAVHGAAMGFSKALWAQLGGFDEGFFPAYWEEVDFCERVRRAAHSVVVAPRAVVRHAEASSTGKYSAQFYGYYLRNRLRYAAKWYDQNTLWYSFRPAEHARLATAPLLDCRVARLVYTNGVPRLAVLSAEERKHVRQLGVALQAEQLNDKYAAIFDQLKHGRENSVHHETAFHSRFGALARFRNAWNNIATRWYVRPNFDQQTRYNLALERALTMVVEQEATRAAAQALDIALLEFRLAQASSTC